MSITFGATNPSQVTLNLDSVFGTSLAAYNKTLVDNIGATNAFFYKMLKSNFYESQDGGAYIQTPLMYQLGTADSYDGYDELSTLPTDGITDVIYQWRQIAIPIAYSMKEVKLNKQRIVSLVKARIQQAEMGIQEYWATAFFQGNGTTLTTAKTSAINGSSSIDPIFKLVSYDNTSSLVVGNIDQSTSTWWANKKKASAATTYDALLNEFQNIYNTVTLGTGGEPDLIVVDQTTFELYQFAIYQRWRQTTTDANFPFNHIKYKNAYIVMDDKMPDVATPVATNASTKGTSLLLNTKFFRVIYESESNFQMLKDDSGKTFQKPINGDSRVGHIGWMGNVCVNNRRKHGIHGNIARTLTVS